jgi:metal-responsive CopG/Arc/MetJ family transcriptional regulator
MATRTEKRRVKISVSVDPAYLAEVDRYVAEHPELDRSKVIDEALMLWYARRQDEEMMAQFTEPLTEEQAEEMADWRHIQQAAAERIFGSR